jgi:glycosyltransferase involved in cell wall biosynthesis
MISDVGDAIKDCDILHVNYEPGLMPMVVDWKVQAWKAMGKRKPAVLTLHTSREGDNRSAFTYAFDRVVVHEKTTDGFTQIPMGVPEYPNLPYVKIFSAGTAGFPFPWKGFHALAQALPEYKLLFVGPESGHVDTFAMKSVIERDNKNAVYLTRWMDGQAVSHQLATCECSVFFYEGGNYGISGAVRMGLAAGRPVLLTRNRQFRDLFDYEDELYFIPLHSSVVDIRKAVQQVLEDKHPKKPKRILEDMGWSKVGQQYKALYDSL